MDFAAVRDLLLGFISSADLHFEQDTAPEMFSIWNETFALLTREQDFPKQFKIDYSLVDGTRYIEHVKTLRDGNKKSMYQLPGRSQSLLGKVYRQMIPGGNAEFVCTFREIDELMQKIDTCKNSDDFVSVLRVYPPEFLSELRVRAHEFYQASLRLSARARASQASQSSQSSASLSFSVHPGIWRKMVKWYTSNYLAAFLEVTKRVLSVDHIETKSACVDGVDQVDIDSYILKVVHERSCVFLPMTIAGIYLMHLYDSPNMPEQKSMLFNLATSIALNRLNELRVTHSSSSNNATLAVCV
jgi:hypothetical protein